MLFDVIDLKRMVLPERECTSVAMSCLSASLTKSVASVNATPCDIRNRCPDAIDGFKSL